MKREMIGFEGERFGRLVVLECIRSPGLLTRWRCVCDCGKETMPLAGNVIRGLTKGCGCKVLLGNHVHGKHGSREYRSWNMMVQRCTNPKNLRYANYGGRGITVCDRWKNSFAAFFEDMGERPANTSIDRIYVEGNYEPGNCRWADPVTQANNKRARSVTA